MRTTRGVTIFLSYRHDDTRHMAGRLYDRLAEHFGASNVFMDVDSIEPGLDFGEAIGHAVGQCDVLVALIGTAWLTSTDQHGKRRLDDPNDWVSLEIRTALTRGIRIVPVLIDGATAPREQDLPDVLAPLARRNAIRIDHGTFRTDIGRLLDALAQANRAGPPSATRDSIEPSVPTELPPTPGAGRAGTPRIFPTVWLTHVPPKPAIKPDRYVGQLEIDFRGVTFQSRRYSLHIPRRCLLRSSAGLAGSDRVNTWVHLLYLDEAGTTQTVFLCDGRLAGWRGILGGTRDIEEALGSIIFMS